MNANRMTIQLRGRARRVLAVALASAAGAAGLLAADASAQCRYQVQCDFRPDLVVTGVTADASYSYSLVRVKNQGTFAAGSSWLSVTDRGTAVRRYFWTPRLYAGESVNVRVNNLCNRSWDLWADATQVVSESNENNFLGVRPSCF